MADPTPSSILQRIARSLGGEAVLAALAGLSPRDLHSLLLHLHANEAAQQSPLELLARYERTPAFALGFVDPRTSLAFAQAAFDAAADFEAVELSPVCPLGTVNVLSGIHQNSVLSASRGAELVADPTPMLALECARRRRRPADRATPVRLCTSQRLVRMQPAPAGLLPHFRLFALVTAAQRGPTLPAEPLRQQLGVYLRLFAALGARGYRFDEVTVSLAHTDAVTARLRAAGIDPASVRREIRTEVWNDPDALLRSRGLAAVRGRFDAIRPSLQALPPGLVAELEQLDAAVLAPLAAEFPTVQLQLDLGRLEGLGYYAGPCLRICARDPSGLSLPLVDGGFTRWTQELLGDRRERFLITGIGSDLACARYREAPPVQAP